MLEYLWSERRESSINVCRRRIVDEEVSRQTQTEPKRHVEKSSSIIFLIGKKGNFVSGGEERAGRERGKRKVDEKNAVDRGSLKVR